MSELHSCDPCNCCLVSIQEPWYARNGILKHFLCGLSFGSAECDVSFLEISVHAHIVFTPLQAASVWHQRQGPHPWHSVSGKLVLLKDDIDVPYMCHRS